MLGFGKSRLASRDDMDCVTMAASRSAPMPAPSSVASVDSGWPSRFAFSCSTAAWLAPDRPSPSHHAKQHWRAEMTCLLG